MVFALWGGVFGIGSAAASVTVKITVSAPGEVRIRIESLPAGMEWSFRNAYAGVLGLAERIEQFRAFGAGGADLGAKKIATGEFRAGASADAVDYVVKLPLPSAADVAHVSWITRESGFLMLADLLPHQLTDVRVEFLLSGDWGVASGIEADARPDGQMTYRDVAPENAIFFLARNMGRDSKTVEGAVIETLITGEWPFKQATVMKAATKVLEKYLDLTGFKLKSKTTVMIAPLPVATGSVKWRAETRGSTVILLMDPDAPVTNWLGQMGIIFTHELLHLWVPNSLLLQGDYDWFFEGFTLYTALVTALELKFIDRKEYLATLARVYDSYLSRPDELSLIDASERRWTTGNSVVYDKGMLVAFLYDLGVRKDSRGKMSLANIYKRLFARPAGLPENGNEVIIQLLSSTPAGADLAKNYIEGQQELDLKPLFADQKQLLKSLYYR